MHLYDAKPLKHEPPEAMNIQFQHIHTFYRFAVSS